MKTKDLFRRVCAICPMEQNEFLGYFGDCLRVLLAAYPTPMLCGDNTPVIPGTLEEDCGFDDLYFGALVSGVLARKTRDADYAACWARESDAAYRKNWRAAAKHRRALPGGDGV